MVLLNAITRGAVAFVVIMSLGAGGLMLRDGVDMGSVSSLMDDLPESGGLEQTIDGFKASLQRSVDNLM
ncbi:hypothetical protein M8756_14020 [Lutimaribacter sp. EGI FJ00015]|uniref:Uncharacterized protein n=1 Tax=Lutimaribacter degradans TaxID=2945989 RepID=A0ACC5ZY30_9RHOB|nr:hypothetical protein [Lutimaribacter sp. EGI FJ00013]MCM2563246.1 hypothetical protein [Lutimaribacter sp. EGI FJ00013]MCO0614431.1 hypothetical protein [Lutimaribacter sp. EGI FJ00015]